MNNIKSILSDSRLEFNRRYCIWSARQFRFKFPHIRVKLFRTDWSYFLVPVEVVDNISEISKTFAENIKPIGCSIKLTADKPDSAVEVEETSSLDQDQWQMFDPLTNSDADEILFLRNGGLPDGNLTFDAQASQWIFESQASLDDAGRQAVTSGIARACLVEAPVIFKIAQNSPAKIKLPPHALQRDFLRLPLSKHGRPSAGNRRLLEEDEEKWRKFAETRSSESIAPLKPSGDEFSCLFFADDKSDVGLSELLTLYNRVDLVPSTSNSTLTRLGISVTDLQELIQLGRVRLVVPGAFQRYDPNLLEPAIEANAGCVMLSRELATLTILHGQLKDPLLYGPFSDDAKSQILQAISRIGKGSPLEKVLSGYGNILSGQQRAFSQRGAQAAMGFGMGALIGNAVHEITGRDLRLELMTAGAQLEWGLSLGSTYLPPVLTEDFSFDSAAAFVGSFYGRAHRAPKDPMANRVNAVVTGLLLPSTVGAVEIARNFNPTAIRRFRSVAQGLFNSNMAKDELEILVQEINKEVEQFEKRSSRLSKWGFSALVTTTLVHGSTAPLEETIGLGGVNFGGVAGRANSRILATRIS